MVKKKIPVYVITQIFQIESALNFITNIINITHNCMDVVTSKKCIIMIITITTTSNTAQKTWLIDQLTD